MGVLELEQETRPLFETSGEFQPDPFEQELVMASWLVSLECESIVIFIAKARLPPEIEGEEADPYPFDARLGFAGGVLPDRLRMQAWSNEAH